MTTAARKNRFVPSLYPLEGRELLSATLDGVSKLLTVKGTIYNDTIKVSQRGADIWVEESYSAGGVGVTSSQSFPVGKVNKILIFGYEGRDSITTWGVNVAAEIRGGPGNDSLYGGLKGDTIYGQDGDDLIYGNEGNDLLYGGDGNDTLYGYTGDDELFGQEGHDSLKGDAGSDTLWGYTGNDTLVGTAGADRLNGWTGNDRLEITLNLDDLIANRGRTIAHSDNYAAGNGTDTFVVTLDLDSFGRRFLKPLTDEVSRMTYTVQPILDLLNRKVPVISQFDSRLTFGSILSRTNPEVGRFIDAVNTVRGFANSVGTWTGQITLGTFTVTSGSQAITTVSANPLSQINSTLLPRLRNAGFSLGLLESPKSAVEMMLGKNVSLFQLKLPTLDVGASYGQRWDIPTGLWGVYIKATLTVSARLRAGATFGMDTVGIWSGNVLKGLYVRDASVSLSAGLTATGGVAAGIPGWMDLAEAGLSGTLTGTLTFTLRDPNGDGKVYFDELPNSYSSAFTRRGQLDYNLSGYLKYWHILEFRNKKNEWTFSHGTFTV